MTRVSFVIPTRNNARTIVACVASALRQEGPVEVIVVDNHSTDGTLELASAHGADLVRVAGPERSAQRNRGAEMATGDVVVFIDSDMVVGEGLAAALRVTFSDPAVGAAVLPETAFGVGYLAGCRALEKRLYLGVASAEAARAFRAEVLAQVGSYDETMFGFEDYELADRVHAHGWTIGRAAVGVQHDEGRVRLRALWRKKRYYGTQWAGAAAAQRQHGRLRRFALRPSVLLADPLHLPGLILLKVVDLSGLAMGHRSTRLTRARRARPVAADVS